MSSSFQPSVPWYFCAPEPYHFRLSAGTCEELCLDEEFVRSLPRTPVQHARWLRLAGGTADEYPLASLGPKSYRPSPRYVLQRVALAGNSHGTHLMFDYRGWAVLLEHHGLPEFIINRAVAYAVFRGEAEGVVRTQLNPTDLDKTADRRVAQWAIGIERATGLATIIDGSQRSSVTRFLMTGEAFGGPFETIF
jgi:hypothetical protein